MLACCCWSCCRLASGSRTAASHGAALRAPAGVLQAPAGVAVAGACAGERVSGGVVGLTGVSAPAAGAGAAAAAVAAASAAAAARLASIAASCLRYWGFMYRAYSGITTSSGCAAGAAGSCGTGGECGAGGDFRCADGCVLLDWDADPEQVSLLGRCRWVAAASCGRDRCDCRGLCGAGGWHKSVSNPYNAAVPPLSDASTPALRAARDARASPPREPHPSWLASASRPLSIRGYTRICCASWLFPEGLDAVGERAPSCVDLRIPSRWV